MRTLWKEEYPMSNDLMALQAKWASVLFGALVATASLAAIAL